MISSKTKIGLLVAAHVGGGLFLAATYRDSGRGASQMDVGLYSLVLAEAGLLGIWGALGTTRPIVRLPTVLTATTYLCVLMMAAERNWSLWPTLGIVYLANIGLPTTVIVLVLSGLRCKLCFAQSVALSPTAKRFQFTIRHVLLITAVVAVVLAIGRGVRAFTDKESNIYLVSIAIIVPWVIMVELASLWAALGIGQPMRRLAVVIPAPFVVGAISVYYRTNLIPVPTDWTIYASESSIFGFHAVISAVSLLVIRSNGWRLVSGTGGQGENLPTPPSS